MRHEQLVRARRCEHLGGVNVDECAGIAQIDHGDGISRAGKHTGQRGGCLGSQVAFGLGRSRHGRLEHAPRRRLGTNPAGPRLVGETFVGGAVIGDTAVGGGSTVAPDRAAPADETLPDEPSPSFEHPRTDNSTTIVTTENIAISTVRRRRTYVSSRVDIIRPPGGFARRRGPTRPPACVTMPRRIRPILRRGGRICFAIAHLPDCSHRRPPL